jgi:hypothetical protein
MAHKQLDALVRLGKLKTEAVGRLQHTLDLPPEQWRVLDEAHRRRNIAEYEGGMDIDAQLVEAVVRVAAEVARKVSALRRE